MAWVQVGPHKINTSQICYIEQKGDSIRIQFHGQWDGNPLELHQEDARMFWRHMKAEDVNQGRDKGSATVLPRMRSAVTLQVGLNEGPDKPRPLPNATGQSPPSTQSPRPHEAPRRH